MFFGEYQNDDLVVDRVIAALDLVLNELTADKQWYEVHAESADTIEGALKEYGSYRKILERVGIDVPLLTQEELHGRLSEKRNRTDQKSGAYEKRIAEIEAFKTQVQSKVVLWEASEKILELLMVGLARASSKILSSMECGHREEAKYLSHMIVFARAIHAGFGVSLDLKYPFTI